MIRTSWGEDRRMKSVLRLNSRTEMPLNNARMEGVNVPFSLYQTEAEDWTIPFTDIKRDISLDDKQFEKPDD